MALAVSTTPHPPALIDHARVDQVGVDQVASVLDDMRDVEIKNSKHLAKMMADVEEIRRRAHALSIDLLTACDQAGLHYQDGHSSAKNMSRHVSKLSGAEAAGREKCRRMFSRLDRIASAYRNGEIGTDQVMLLGRVFANPRVRGAMEGRQKCFIEDAKRLSFPRFQKRILEWERLIDEDGPEPPGDRAVENRTANMNQNPHDLSWDLVANFPSVDGATMNKIHRAYCKALFDLDWAEAKARVGNGVCKADLRRTHAQRKADAWLQISLDAAANKDGMAPLEMTHEVAWSASAYQEMVRRWAGAAPRPFDVDDYRCETVDGDPLDPTEAFANSVLNKIRRIVIDAKGVVIDMAEARYFTGLARSAVRFSGRECFWPGCWVPATDCEIDHTHDHARGGRTNPGNGAPGCGRHNRWKQKGYTVWRDKHGTIHVQRPDGTLID